jgi:transcriptional regulator MraZ
VQQQLFVFNYTNKIDRKGRVSVPAQFRQILAAKGSDMVVLYPHQKYGAIQGSGMDWLMDYHARVDQMPEDEDRYALESLFAQVHQLGPDAEGRIILPENLIEIADIKESVLFAGKGDKFELWDPARFAAHNAAMLARVKERNLAPPPLARAPRAAS